MMFINKEIHITDGGREVEPTKICGKPLVPRVGSLLQAVEKLLQQTEMNMCRWVDETRGLLAVVGLLKTAMEKDILDIKVVNRPRP